MRRLIIRILVWSVVAGFVLGVILAAIQWLSPAAREHAEQKKNAQGTTTAQVPVPPAPPAGSEVPSTSAAAPGRVVGIARGCLGGQDPSTAALAAQREAALTPEGAAEFAATIIRWGDQYPTPETSKTQVGQLVSPDAPEKSRRIGQWPDSYKGATGYTSFLQGRWYVDSFTAGQEAEISVLSKTVVDFPGEGTKTKDMASKVHLKVVDGRWTYFEGTAGRSPEQMQSIGTPYSAGC